MCLIIVAYGLDPSDYPFVVAANRDEFYERPTSKAQFWGPEKKGALILAGKDLQAGGTWLGIKPTQSSFRFAAVTNYREVSKQTKDDKETTKRSRGALVTAFLTSDVTANDFLLGVQEHASSYAGFNLLVGDTNGLWYFSNRGDQGLRKLEPGRVYGLCNRLLDDPWPKVLRSKHGMSVVMKEINACTKEEAIGRLFRLLRDTAKAPTDQLPTDTGHSQDIEKLFSSVFIESDWYGTRASTVFMVQASPEEDSQCLFTCSFSERSFGADGKYLGDVNEEFKVKSAFS